MICFVWHSWLNDIGIIILLLQVLLVLFLTNYCASIFALLYLCFPAVPLPQPWLSCTLWWVVLSGWNRLCLDGTGYVQLELAVSSQNGLGQPWPPLMAPPQLLLLPGPGHPNPMQHYIHTDFSCKTDLSCKTDTELGKCPVFQHKALNILKLSVSLASCQQGSLAASFCAHKIEGWGL